MVTQTKAMGQKRGRAEGSFVRETASQAVEFSRDIVQNLKAWQAPAPKLREEKDLDAAEPPREPVPPAWTEPGESDPPEQAPSETGEASH